mgnify:FL=1
MKKIYLNLALALFFCLSNQTLKALTYHLSAGGNPLLAASWGTNTAGTSGSPTQFSGTHTWNLGTNNSAITLSSNWTVAPTAIINVGDGTNPFNFIISANLTIGTTAQPLINFNNASTLTLNATDNFNSASSKTQFKVGSTVIYGTGSDNNVKTTYIDNYHHLILDVARSLNGTGLTIDGDLTVNADFDVATGLADIGGNAVLNANVLLNQGAFILHGTMSGTGAFDGDNIASSLTFNGTGSIGALRLLSPFQLANLDISLGSASSSLTLGTNLIIDGGSALFNVGCLALNGNNLNIEAAGAVDFSGGGTIKGSSTSVVKIDGGITGSMNMDATSNSLRGLILNSNGNTLTLGNALNVTDSVIVTDGTLASAGNLTLKADNNRTARIGSMGATGAITGNVTVETIAKAGLTGWTNLGVSGVTGQVLSNWDGQIPMTCNGCTYPQNATGSWFNSVQSWDETINDYDTLITSSTPLSIGRGFWVYLGNGFSSTSDMNWSVTGPVNQGAGIINVSQTTTGDNLIANPYPCPISWSKFFLLNLNAFFLNGTASVYNPDGPGFTSFVQGVWINGASEVIQAGQGFFVSATASVSLDYDESIKVDPNTYASNPMLRSSSANKPYYGDVFKLRLNGVSGDKDEMAFRIHPSATAAFDGKWDAKKTFISPGYVGYPGPYSKYTSVSAKDAFGKDYSIMSFAPPTQSLTVPVLVKASTSGNYTLSAAEFDNFNGCILLHDKLSNIYKDLRKGDYVFYLSDTTSSPRFEMVFCESGVAPLSVPALNTASSILISQDKDGVFVQTAFEQNTKAVISVYNVIGQQLMKDMLVEGTDSFRRLNLDANNQVIIVRVTTDKESVTKKLITK